MPAYAIENLSVSFPQGRSRQQVISNLSLKVEPSELVVILGPTGAGKTTLLRSMAGLQKPDQGRILEGEKDITTMPPHQREMAMVFQNFSLYPRMTVKENLAFPLYAKQAKGLKLSAIEIEKRIHEAAEILGLSDKLLRRPQELSGGELQRVAIGRALVRKPKLFLFDEPLASLDAKLRERMMIEIRRLQRSQNCSMIYVTHDHEEAMSLADRLLILDQGKILQTGTPAEIYHKPKSTRVAKMLGRPGINILSIEESARLGLPNEAKKIIGIRPENWKVTADINGPAVASVVEHLGPQIALVLDVQGLRLRVSVAANLRVKVGDRFKLGIDPGVLVYLEG